MTRFEVFQLLCEGLRPSFSPSRPDLPDVPVPWAMVVEASSYHLVTPALGWCLRDSDAVPKDLAEYFDAVLSLNRERNGHILDSLTSALQDLNAAGVRPVLLKGAAALAEDLYPDAGMRVLGDIDLLVPEAQLSEAARVLTTRGFVPPETAGPWFVGGQHHLPRQIHPDLRAGIELHRHVVTASCRSLIDAGSCLERARPFSFRGVEAFLPSATDRITHNIVHSQIQNGDRERGIPELRQLLDLAMLRARYESEITWSDVARRFKQGRCLPVFTDTLALAEALLGQAVPEGLPKSGTAPLSRLETALERPGTQRRAAIRSLARGYSRQVREDPISVLNLLQPSRWPARLFHIARHVRTPKW